MENRADYERKRSELNHRYANPEWMKDNEEDAERPAGTENAFGYDDER